MARTPITSATTYYVSTSGSDLTGDGTSGNPWATPQHAINYVCDNLDIQDALVTIQLNDGTYTNTQGGLVLKPYVGTYTRDHTNVVINGNNTTPSNVVLKNSPSSGSVIGGINCYTTWTIQNLEIDGSGGVGVLADWGTSITLGSINWGAAGTNQIQAQYNSLVELLAGGAHTIKGGAGQFANATNGSIILAQYQQGSTPQPKITINSGLSYSGGFATASNLGICDLTNVTWAGSTFTGSQYYANNALCPGGINIPASAAGTAPGFGSSLGNLLNLLSNNNSNSNYTQKEVYGISSVTSWSTLATLTPAVVTNVYTEAMVEARIAGDTNSVGSGIRFSRWRITIANGAPTVGVVGTDVTDGSAIQFRLNVSGNNVQVQVQSADGTHSSDAGFAELSYYLPNNNPAANLTWTIS